MRQSSLAMFGIKSSKSKAADPTPARPESPSKPTPIKPTPAKVEEAKTAARGKSTTKKEPKSPKATEPKEKGKSGKKANPKTKGDVNMESTETAVIDKKSPIRPKSGKQTPKPNAETISKAVPQKSQETHLE